MPDVTVKVQWQDGGHSDYEFTKVDEEDVFKWETIPTDEFVHVFRLIDSAGEVREQLSLNTRFTRAWKLKFATPDRETVSA